MFSRTVGTIVLAASALTAQAMLLPPGIASAGGNPGLASLTTDSLSIRLPCSECVFPVKQAESTEAKDGDDMFWIQGGANDVLLNFTLSDDKQALELDGYPLYPPSLAVVSTQPRPHVDQVAASASLVDIKDNKVDVRSLRISEDTVFIGDEALPEGTGSIIRVTYQIMAVEGQPVSIDGATVAMLKDTTGHLMIVNVEAVPRHHSIFDSLPGAEMTSPPPHHADKAGKEKDCSKLPALICKWKNVVESKMNGLKAGMHHKGGCPGKQGGRKHLPGHIKPNIHWEGKPEDKPANFPDRHPKMEGDRPERPHSDQPDHGRHHHGHHRHHRGHFLHKLLKGFVSVLIPVMAGITMGLAAGLVSMLAGRLVTYCWIKFRHGGQRGYASVAQSEVADEDTAEKGEIFIEETESLPVYEEAPEYVEKEVK